MYVGRIACVTNRDITFINEFQTLPPNTRWVLCDFVSTRQKQQPHKVPKFNLYNGATKCLVIINNIMRCQWSNQHTLQFNIQLYCSEATYILATDTHIQFQCEYSGRLEFRLASVPLSTVIKTNKKTLIEIVQPMIKYHQPPLSKKQWGRQKFK